MAGGGEIAVLERITQLVGEHRLAAPAQDDVAFCLDVTVHRAFETIGLDEDRHLLVAARAARRQQGWLQLELESEACVRGLRLTLLRASLRQRQKQEGEHNQIAAKGHRGLLV